MPIRVRCRCGQELVLRYGEWVYIFIGLVLLSLIVNLVVLVLLYLRLEEVSRRSTAPEPSRKSPPTTAEDKGLEENGRPRAAIGVPVKAGAPASGERATPPQSSGTTAQPRPLRALEPAGDMLPAGSSSLAARETPYPERSTDGSSLSPGPLDRGGASAPGEPIRLPAPEVPPSERPPESWSREPLLVRFFLLQMGGDDLLPPEAFLADPDLRLRQAAVERSLATSRAASSDERIDALVGAAAGLLGEVPRGGEILRRHGLAAQPGSSAERYHPSLHGDLREKAAPLLGDPAVQTLREYLLSAPEGIDAVLIVDVSRSMREPLAALQSAATWLLPCVRWALPGSRWGLVLYRDDVEATAPLSTGDEGVVLRVLADARAEGGGDVPEGVHRALRAALSLGNFSWRRNVPRHLILLGDAPPPYAERSGLLLLAQGALAEGGYRTHALSFASGADFPELVPFFPELARRGGGRSAVLDGAAELGQEVLLCIFPSEARAALVLVSKALRGLFVPS